MARAGPQRRVGAADSTRGALMLWALLLACTCSAAAGVAADHLDGDSSDAALSATPAAVLAPRRSLLQADVLVTATAKSSTAAIVISVVLLFAGSLGAWLFQQRIESDNRKHEERLEVLRGDMNKELYTMREEMKEAGRVRLKQETLADLMRAYKLPLLAASFDLQSRLTQLLGGVRWARAEQEGRVWARVEPPEDPSPAEACFLSRFCTPQRHVSAYGGDAGDARVAWDADYAIDSTLFCVGELLGWLEVIRREVTFIQGSDAAVNVLLDALRFQFSGEAPEQGAGAEGEDFRRMQLYNAEQRQIGEVMIASASDAHPEKEGSHHRIIGYSNFLQLMHMDASALTHGGAADVALSAPERELLLQAQRFQRAFAKLRADCLAVAEQPERRPRRRLAMLRALLCRLIDELDPSGDKTELDGEACAAAEAAWAAASAADVATAVSASVSCADAPAPKLGRAPSRALSRLSLRLGKAGAAEAPQEDQLSQTDLVALLMPPADAWGALDAADDDADTSRRGSATGIGTTSARLVTEEDTRVPLIPRQAPRWDAQYDRNLPLPCLTYLRRMYSQLHELRRRALLEHQRRLQWVLERETIEGYRDAMAAATSSGGLAGAGSDEARLAALRRALPASLAARDAAAREVLRRVARLERTERLGRADTSGPALDNMRVVLELERAASLPPPARLRRGSSVAGLAGAGAGATPPRGAAAAPA